MTNQTPMIAVVIAALSLLGGATAFAFRYEARISTLEAVVKDQSDDLKYIREKLDDMNDKLDNISR